MEKPSWYLVAQEMMPSYILCCRTHVLPLIRSAQQGAGCFRGRTLQSLFSTPTWRRFQTPHGVAVYLCAATGMLSSLHWVGERALLRALMILQGRGRLEIHLQGIMASSGLSQPTIFDSLPDVSEN